MNHTRFARTNLSVSAVGFGALQIASKIDYPAAERLLNLALDLGINLLDSARGYQESEARIGRAISHRRDQFVIATKATNASRAEFWQSLDDSLTRMRTDYIDIYQFHGAGLNAKDFILAGETVIECMQQAQQQGKIRFIGFSSHSLEASRELMRTGLFDVIQYPISYVGSEAAEKGLVEEAARLDLGFLGMKPFGGGRLGQARYCLGYVFQFPSVVPLVGFETEAELREVVELTEAGITLTETDLSEMARIKAELGDKFCRGCCYCQPCPQGVAIWMSMFLQVFRKQFGDDWLQADYYRQQIGSIENCTECGVCLGRCPFGLEIPDILKEQAAQYQAWFGA